MTPLGGFFVFNLKNKRFGNIKNKLYICHMGNITEVIVRSINFENKTYIDSKGVSKTIQPSTAYLLLNSDKTHERYVTDEKGIISKQTRDLIDKNIKLSDTGLGRTQSDFNTKVSQKLEELSEGLDGIQIPIYDDELLREEIADVNTALENLQTEIENLELGQVTDESMFVLRQQKNILNNEFVDIQNRYFAIINDEHLYDSVMLRSVYENPTFGYLKRYNDLIQFFDTAFQDTTITQSEKDTLNTLFDNYRASLGSLSIEMQKAQTRIADRRQGNVIETVEGIVDGINIEIDEVGRNLTELEDSYLDFASDGVFSVAETQALKTYIQLLNNEKADVYARFEELNNNSKLTGNSKTVLINAYADYHAAHSDLTSKIILATTDHLATSEETTAVNNAFAVYRNKLSILSRAFEIAVNSIYSISLDDLRLQIDGEVGDLINELLELSEQIGDLPIGAVSDAALFAIQQQKNLVENEYTDLSRRYEVIVADPFLTDNTALVAAYGDSESGYVDAFEDLFEYLNTAFSDVNITQAEKDQLQALINIYRAKLSVLSEELQKALRTIEESRIQGLRNELQDEIVEVRLEISDVDDRVGDLQFAYDNFSTDGVFSIAEAKALEKYINTLNNEAADLEAKFNVVYTNEFLDGIPKTDLASKYSTYTLSHTDLIQVIGDAIQDGLATPQDKAAVDAAFVTYRTGLSDLGAAFEVALNYINTTKVNDLNSKIFDGTGFFDPEKIKPLSIQTKHISIGDRMQRFSLPGVTFYLEDNYTSLRHTAGTIVHQTVDITTKTWTIAANKITGITNAFQYIYIKADRVGTTATVHVTPLQINVEQDPDYFHFEAGYISALQNGIRVVKTTFGFAQINPAELSIGKWSDPNNPYQYIEFNTEGIDIVANRIRFMDSADVVVDVEEAIDEVAANVNYKVEILSSNGNMFRNDNISTTLTAKVFYGKDDITATLPQGSFTWSRTSHDTVADEQWNLLYANFHSNVLSISGDDVEGKAVFNCNVIIPN